MRLGLGGVAVDLEEFPAVGIGEGQGDVPGPLVRHGTDVVTLLDGDPQNRRRHGGGRRDWGSLIPAVAAEAQQKQDARGQAPDQRSGRLTSLRPPP
jgi:hypothetical protein